MLDPATQHAFMALSRIVPDAVTNGKFIGKGRFGTVIALNGYAYKIGSSVYLARELQLLRRMHALKTHAHLVPLLSWWRTRKYTVFKFPLFTTSGYLFTRHTGLDETHIMTMVQGLAAGMIALHNFGILHLDPKPENTLVRNNHWVLSDYGNSSQDSSLATKGIHYTCLYRSPLASHGIANTATDVYALALTTWELATGEPLCLTEEGNAYQDMAAYLNPADFTMFQKMVASSGQTMPELPSTPRALESTRYSPLVHHYRQTMNDCILNFSHSGAALFLDYWSSHSPLATKSPPPKCPQPPSRENNDQLAPPPPGAEHTSPTAARAAPEAPLDRTGSGDQNSFARPASRESRTQ